MRQGLILSLLLVLFSVLGWSQVAEPIPAELVTYPEMIVYNGKIVTMDDASFDPNPGTVAQAMAVRKGKVLAMGNDAEIRGLAGPQTKVIDLKGRTVLPGLITTHEHTQEYAYTHQPVVQQVLTDDDVVARWVKGDNLEAIMRNVAPTLREAVAKAKPGQWIRLELFRGEQDQFRTPLTELPRKLQPINKSLLDRIAPNNPVAIKSGVGMLINQKALEQYLTLYEADQQLRRTGVGGTRLYRRIENDLMMAGKVDLMAKLYKEELSWWSGYGFTTVAGHQEGYQMLAAYRLLEKTGEMPVRYAWGYRDFPFDLDDLGLRRLSDLQGTGSDYLWLVGAHGQSGGSCTIAPASPEVKRNESCSFAPGSSGYQEIYRIVRAGGRIATMHSSGDRDIDFLLDAIERASRDAGFTLDEIRSKRHAFDHCQFAPRPDQIFRIKQLGMIVSCQSVILYEPVTERLLQNYGPRMAERIVPRKLLADSQVMNTFEIDRPIGHTDRNAFFYLHLAIARRSRNGDVIGPGQRIDRVTSLKTATVWAGYYVLREDLLGSLEPSKFADFIVLDRDFLTIPEDEIPKINVLMTVMGGKVMHLVPEMAREIGLQPVGAQVRSSATSIPVASSM